MTRLKLSDLADEKPVRLTIEVSARLHKELVAYATALNGGDAKGAPPPERLIPPMIERFIATDRSYAKGRRAAQPG
ncbi:MULTISPECIES: DUF2274 domain-containing protein [unclassified Novosphingobium]|jgi:hypothetical protein|uniref:DUF2274 domain-containing protein n=1 Tax=unclassified Novosphingobium TaxID=2644732 RepID=UPI0025EA62A4|nr:MULTISPECIES: DUF2274 domain-containing protein [unclassified Novosphingobium]HQV01850.1 DUF2274 domain-containing protein [Novosphingobium sp.]